MAIGRQKIDCESPKMSAPFLSMNEQDLQDADATSEQGALAPATHNRIQGKDEPFSFLEAASKRSFSESEVSQLITIRFLVERMNDLRKEIEDLRPYQAKYYEKDRDLQIAHAKAGEKKRGEIAALSLTTIGGAGIGMAIKFFEQAPLWALVGFILSAGLVATGVYLKGVAK